MIDTARQILQKAYESHIYLYLPIDHIVTTEFSANAEAYHVARGNIGANQMGMDIGPLTIEKFKGALKGARTVFWNGPVGVFEFPKFATGTMSLAKAIAELPDCVTVIGGGDSVAAVNKSGVADKISHMSTGGGASPELVEGKVLPGVAALLDK
jgi:phosphoglycerate kinase